MKVGIAYKQGAGGLPAGMPTKETPVASDMMFLLDSENNMRPVLISLAQLAAFMGAIPASGVDCQFQDGSSYTFQDGTSYSFN